MKKNTLLLLGLAAAGYYAYSNYYAARPVVNANPAAGTAGLLGLGNHYDYPSPTRFPGSVRF